MYTNQEIQALIILEQKAPGYVGTKNEVEEDWLEDVWNHTPPYRLVTLTRSENKLWNSEIDSHELRDQPT